MLGRNTVDRGKKKWIV